MHLTNVQAEVLRIVAEWIQEHGGESPSLREIADQRRRGSNRNCAVQALRYLEQKGCVRRLGPKNIRILDPGIAFLSQDVPW